MGKCFRCSSSLGECGQLGYYSDKAPGRGSLYLLTREDEPFCGNQFKINVMFTSTRIPIHTYGRLQILLVDKNGLNETHPITADVDDLLTSGAQLEKLLIVHPAIIPVEAHILYVAYEGWIYSGRFQWSLDKLVLTDSYGEKKSFCQDKGKLLPSGLPVKLSLSNGDCIGGTSTHQPEYPILPFKKYPSGPNEQFSHPKKQFKPLKGNKLKPGAGQDVYYVSNSVSQAEENSVNDKTILNINDEVAPISIPEVHTFISKNPEVPHDVGPAYKVEKPRPQKPQRYHYHIKQNAKWPKQSQNRIPIPAWGPPSDGYQGSHKFPARRRPSTQFSGTRPVRPLSSHLLPPPPPIKPVSHINLSGSQEDLSASQSESSPEQSDESTDDKFDLINEPVLKDNSSKMEMHMLSDDQLTIVKFGPESEDEEGNHQEAQDYNEDEQKQEYIVLHKLPNGEALNLENLQTYNMADIAQGKVQSNQNEDTPQFGMGDAPNDRPR